MSTINDNCVIYTKDPEIIGKLVIRGYKIHYDEDLSSLIIKIGEIHPDSLVATILHEVNKYPITTLIEIRWHILIAGGIPHDMVTHPNICILPEDSPSEKILEEVIENIELNDKKPQWDKIKILIIEDNADILEMYNVAFASKWYDISLAADGLSGMTKAVTLRPEIIILDIMMPHMDGFEVLHALKENTSLDSTVIVNSNLEWVDEEKRVKDLGADYFFRKSNCTPLDIIDFIEKNKFH
jgi:CheY-like chemotaxis protein